MSDAREAALSTEAVNNVEKAVVTREMLLERLHGKQRQRAQQRRPKTLQPTRDITPGSEIVVRNKKEKKEILKQRFDHLKEIIDKENVTALADAKDAKEIQKRYQKEKNQLEMLKLTDFKKYQEIKKEIAIMAQYETKDMQRVKEIMAQQVLQEAVVSPVTKFIKSFTGGKKKKSEPLPPDANVPAPDSDEEGEQVEEEETV